MLVLLPGGCFVRGVEDRSTSRLRRFSSVRKSTPLAQHFESHKHSGKACRHPPDVLEAIELYACAIKQKQAQTNTDILLAQGTKLDTVKRLSRVDDRCQTDNIHTTIIL